MHDKLYIAVRQDLSPGLAAAQAVHAAFQFSIQNPGIIGDWMRDSQYLVIVSVLDEDALNVLANRADAAGIVSTLWHEPDMGDQATALALQPGDVARRLCSNLPLHGRTLEVAKAA